MADSYRINQGEFIICELILPLMSACRRGLVRRGMAYTLGIATKEEEPSEDQPPLAVSSVITDPSSACVFPNGGLCDRD
jgi:hypothetical protein